MSEFQPEKTPDQIAIEEAREEEKRLKALRSKGSVITYDMIQETKRKKEAERIRKEQGFVTPEEDAKEMGLAPKH